MTITDLIWLEEIVEKLAVKHQVTQSEVEEALAGRAQCRKMQQEKL